MKEKIPTNTIKAVGQLGVSDILFGKPAKPLPLGHNQSRDIRIPQFEIDVFDAIIESVDTEKGNLVELEAEFFVHFTDDALVRRLPGLHMTSGKIPHAGIGKPRRIVSEKQKDLATTIDKQNAATFTFHRVMPGGPETRGTQGRRKI